MVTYSTYEPLIIEEIDDIVKYYNEKLKNENHLPKYINIVYYCFDENEDDFYGDTFKKNGIKNIVSYYYNQEKKEYISSEIGKIQYYISKEELENFENNKEENLKIEEIKTRKKNTIIYINGDKETEILVE